MSTSVIVGFSYRKKSWLSALIKGVTASKVSHVFSIVNVGGGQLVYQASGLTVNYTALPVFLEKNIIVEKYEVALTSDQAAKARETRLSQVGKPYSGIQLVGFLWVLGARKFGKKIRNPFSNGTTAYVCCEIIADSIGLDNGESLTPEDFRRWCEKNAKKLP